MHQCRHWSSDLWQNTRIKLYNKVSEELYNHFIERCTLICRGQRACLLGKTSRYWDTEVEQQARKIEL